MFLIGAAYNVQQTLEGAGLGSSNFLMKDGTGQITGGYWSPKEAMIFPLLAILLYCLLLSASYCAAGYALSRRKGLLISFSSLILPGVLSAFGYWPNMNFMPDTYHIGGVGSLGSPYGMATLATISLLSGWTITVLATDILGLQEKFRHAYDHLWYSMAILAGLFFVADAGTSQEMRDLQSTTKHVQQASSYLLSQLRDYAKLCRSTSMGKRVSCIWANNIQQDLIDYSVYDEKLYWKLGPKNTQQLYSSFSEKKDSTEITIRRELEEFNQIQCPATSNQMTMPSSICQRPPAEFCTGANDGNYMIRTVTISNECIIPTLVKLRATMEKQVATAEAAARTKHARWLFYILFAGLAGGKVANATAKFTKTRLGKKGLGDEQNMKALTVTVCKFICKCIRTVVCGGLRLLKGAFTCICSLTKAIRTRISDRLKRDATDLSDG